MSNVAFEEPVYKANKPQSVNEGGLLGWIIALSKGRIQSRKEAVQVLVLIFILLIILSVVILSVSGDSVDESDLPPRNELQADT